MRSYQGRFARFVSLLTIAWLLSSGMVAMAQSTGTIQGTITDESGAALANAQVTVHNLETGVERATQTDSLGSYQVAALPVGTYRIEVHAQRYRNRHGEPPTFATLNQSSADLGIVEESRFQGFGIIEHCHGRCGLIVRSLTEREIVRSAAL